MSVDDAGGEKDRLVRAVLGEGVHREIGPVVGGPSGLRVGEGPDLGVEQSVLEASAAVEIDIDAVLGVFVETPDRGREAIGELYVERDAAGSGRELL